MCDGPVGRPRAPDKPDIATRPNHKRHWQNGLRQEDTVGYRTRQPPDNLTNPVSGTSGNCRAPNPTIGAATNSYNATACGLEGQFVGFVGYGRGEHVDRNNTDG